MLLQPPRQPTLPPSPARTWPNAQVRTLSPGCWSAVRMGSPSWWAGNVRDSGRPAQTQEEAGATLRKGLLLLLLLGGGLGGQERDRPTCSSHSLGGSKEGGLPHGVLCTSVSSKAPLLWLTPDSDIGRHQQEAK